MEQGHIEGNYLTGKDIFKVIINNRALISDLFSTKSSATNGSDDAI